MKVNENIYCERCGKDLKPSDEYIKVEEHERYCSDCYDEESYTCYKFVGEDENGSELYDEFDKEICTFYSVDGEDLGDEIEVYDKFNKEVEEETE